MRGREEGRAEVWALMAVASGKKGGKERDWG